MKMELNILGFLAVATVCYYVLWLLKQVNEWYYCLGKKKLPPGDMGFPFIGNTLSFMRAFRSKDPESFMNNIFQRYGRGGMYKSHLLQTPMIIVTNPELNKAILTDDKNFKLGHILGFLEISGKRSLAAVDGAEHRRLRRLITAPINGNEALSIYIETIETVVKSSLQDMATMNKPVELLIELKLASFKIVTNIFFGPLGFSFLHPLTKLFGDIMKGVVGMPINLPGFAYHNALKARKKLVKIIDNTIEDRKVRNKGSEYNEAKKSMLDLFLEIEDDDGEKMDNETIIDLLNSMLITSHESIATAVVWLLIRLQEYPEILQKVKEEHEEVILKRPDAQKGLTMAEIKKMTYTHKVILESLRMTNVGIGPFRNAAHDVEINGYIIPKGWKVLLFFRSIHLNPDIHPNPNIFDPSRWEESKRRAGTFTPFGLGSRLCPANELAKLEVLIFLHYFILRYKMERINPNSPAEYFPMPVLKDKCLVKISKV